MNKSKKHIINKGFSLMELMVVLLITAVAMAASATLITKKAMTVADTVPWAWIGGRGDVVTNIFNNNRSVMIGANITNPSANYPKLYIKNHIGFSGFNGPGYKPEAPHIELANGEDSIFLSYPGIYNGGSTAILLGNYPANTTPGRASIIIGANAATASNQWEVCPIAIGADSNASTTLAWNPIAIGAGSHAHLRGLHSNLGCAIGANSNGGMSFGAGANSSQSNQNNTGISIGAGTMTTDKTQDNAVGIGAGSVHGHSASTLIGSNSVLYAPWSVTVGADCDCGSKFYTGAGGHGWSPQYAYISLGHNIDATSEWGYHYSIGNNMTVSGVGATAIGNNTNCTANNSVVIGPNIPFDNNYIKEYQATNKDGLVYDESGAPVMKHERLGQVVLIGTGDDIPAPGDLASSRVYIGSSNHTYKFNGDWKIGQIYSYMYNKYFSHWPTQEELDSLTPISSNTRIMEMGSITINGSVDVNNDVEASHNLVRVNGDLISGGLSCNRIADALYGRNDTKATITDLTVEDLTVTRNYFYNSDRRLKNVGEVFKGGLAELRKIQLYHYTFKNDKNKTPRVGIMAQDLQKIFPDAVIKGEDGFLKIRTEDILYAIVNAIKELDEKVSKIAADMDSNLKTLIALQQKKHLQEMQLKELDKEFAESTKLLQEKIVANGKKIEQLRRQIEVFELQ